MPGTRGWKSQDDEDLLHLVEAGFDMESVAWALGRSPSTVRSRLAYLHRETGSLDVPTGGVSVGEASQAIG